MSDAARPRGLGRGLSALLGENFAPDLGRPPAPPPPPQPPFSPVPAPPPLAVATPSEAPPSLSPAPAAAEPGGQLRIPIEHIQRNPSQPRRTFNEEDLRELADSIRSHGVLQPILVRPLRGQPGRYEIVAGERRWRAAQQAELHAIPAVVRDLDEVEILEIGIIENVQRADLNPLEEAMGYQALIERFGRTQQDIADVVGKSRPHIANMLRLLNLPEEIQAMVREGRLSAGHARAVLNAPDPIQLARQAVAQALNVRDIEKLVAQAKDKRDHPARPAMEKDADTRALEERVSAALGLSATIAHKGEAGGEIRVAYKKLEQLDDIVRRLTAQIG